jgi:hypothetical protein
MAARYFFFSFCGIEMEHASMSQRKPMKGACDVKRMSFASSQGMPRILDSWSMSSKQ